MEAILVVELQSGCKLSVERILIMAARSGGCLVKSAKSAGSQWFLAHVNSIFCYDI